MADGIYVTMCGAAGRSEQLDAVADNLANAQTPGFKASRPAFEAFLARSGAADKAYPAAVATALDLRPGPTTRTDEPLHVVPGDGAFLAVALPGGGRAYTRDGRLSVDAAGTLVQGGRPVLDPRGRTITVPPGTAARIAPDGSVTAGGAEVGQLGLFRLAGPVDRVGPSLLAPGAGGRAEASAAGVRTGELELGNAGALEGMVQLIAAQRHFDASMQALQTYRSLDARAADLGRVR
jgi:flagellar basal-body rod protein FlgF